MHSIGRYSLFVKQNKMLKLMLSFYDEGIKALEQGVYLKDIENLDVRNKISRAKYIREEDIEEIDEIGTELKKAIDNLISRREVSLMLKRV